MKVWKIVKKTLAFFGTRPLLADFVRLDARQRILGKRREGVVGLIGQDVAVGEEQDARPPRRLARQVPAALEQRPGDLEGDGGLAGAGGERQQDALLAGGDGFQRVLDGVVLVVARLPGAARAPRTARRRSGRAMRSAVAKTLAQSSSGVG